MTVYRYFKNLNDNTPLSLRLLHPLCHDVIWQYIRSGFFFIINTYIFSLLYACRTPGNSIRFIYIPTCFFFAIYRVYIFTWNLGTVSNDNVRSVCCRLKYIINIVYIVHNMYIIHVYTPSLLHWNSPRVDLYADHSDYYIA